MKATNAYTPPKRSARKYVPLLRAAVPWLVVIFAGSFLAHVPVFGEQLETETISTADPTIEKPQKIDFEMTVGNIVDQSDELVLETLKEAANHGSAKAALALGNRYFEGTGVIEDKKAAVRWWLSASQLGSPQAAYNLGLAYLSGAGTEKDLAKAKTTFLQAANGGVPNAHLALGILNLDEARSQADYRRAGEHFQRAARSGSQDATHNLALLYEKGLGYPQDPEKASYWRNFAPAAEKNDFSINDTTQAEYERSNIPTVHGAEWVMTRSASNYTLQLASGDTLAATQKLISKISALDCAIFKKVFAEKERFVAIAGDFLSYADASLAIEDLPDSFLQNKPFIVNFKLLQRQIDDHTKLNN